MEVWLVGGFEDYKCGTITASESGANTVACDRRCGMTAKSIELRHTTSEHTICGVSLRGNDFNIATNYTQQPIHAMAVMSSGTILAADSRKRVYQSTDGTTFAKGSATAIDVDYAPAKPGSDQFREVWGVD
jgi:hypothetical protein